MVLLCDDIRHHHAGQCPHQAGDVAGHDHAHHRAASQHRIDDQGAGRRNDQTGRCRSDVDGSGKLFIVAFLLLHGDQNAADGNGSCNGGTGQRAEQRVAQNIGVRQTTGDAADQNFCEIDQFLCNAAGVHQNTAEDVERDSQQREAVNARPPCAGWQRRCPDPETGWRPMVTTDEMMILTETGRSAPAAAQTCRSGADRLEKYPF